MKLFDCHTHLFEYPRDEITEILDRAQDSGVAGAILAGTTIETSRKAIELANLDTRLFAGVGIHPMDIEKQPSYENIDEIRHMLDDPRVVAISEVGLDGMEGAPSQDLQEFVLRMHIQLGHETGLPIIYHARFAYPWILDVLREEKAGALGGAALYFQGDLDTAYKCIDMGFYISLARPLLRIKELQEVTRKIPLDAIVLETDCYPQPFKKKRANWTEPRHVLEVAEAVAELKGLELNQIIEQAGDNLIKMLGQRSTEVTRLLGE